MMVLVGATVLIIIAAAVFLFALSVLKRQAGREPETIDTPVSGLISEVPAQEFLADHLGTAHSFMSDGVQGGNPSSLSGLNIERGIAPQFGPHHANLMDRGSKAFATEPLQTELVPQPPTGMPTPWTGTSHQLDPNQQSFTGQGVVAFATEPIQTERMQQFSVPNALQLPSTPAPQPQTIPSTPTDLWERPTGEVVTDPVLEAMMQQVQEGLYVIPERENEPQL